MRKLFLKPTLIPSCWTSKFFYKLVSVIIDNSLDIRPPFASFMKEYIKNLTGQQISVGHHQLDVKIYGRFRGSYKKKVEERTVGLEMETKLELHLWYFYEDKFSSLCQVYCLWNGVSNSCFIYHTGLSWSSIKIIISRGFINCTIP